MCVQKAHRHAIAKKHFMAFAQDRAMIQFGKSATCMHGFGKLLADFKTAFPFSAVASSWRLPISIPIFISALERKSFWECSMSVCFHFICTEKDSERFLLFSNPFLFIAIHQTCCFNPERLKLLEFFWCEPWKMRTDEIQRYWDMKIYYNRIYSYSDKKTCMGIIYIYTKGY